MIYGDRIIDRNSSEIQFDSFELESNTFYEVSFAHLINPNGCSSLVLKAYLQDITSLSKKEIFDSTVDLTTLETIRWTFFGRCFQVFKADNYRIVIEAKNKCNDSKVVIAFDELRVRKMDDSEETTKCLDWGAPNESTVLTTTTTTTINNNTIEYDFTLLNTKSSSKIDLASKGKKKKTQINTKLTKI